MTSHLNYLNVVHLLNVVTHFETLFHAVVIFVSGSYHRYFVTIRAEVILNLTHPSFFIFYWRCSTKLNYDWLSHSCLRLYTSLNVTYTLPLFSRCTVLEQIEEVCIPKNLHGLQSVIFKHIVASVILLKHSYRDSVFVIMSLSILILLFWLIFYLLAKGKRRRRHRILKR